ncbi:hypothetical protein TorRG33x02_123000, partial [Trema orientale]
KRCFILYEGNILLIGTFCKLLTVKKTFSDAYHRGKSGLSKQLFNKKPITELEMKSFPFSPLLLTLNQNLFFFFFECCTP